MKTFYAEDNTDQIARDKYFPDYSYKGTIVEIGAATPVFLSMTKHFKDNGWRAVHVEPNPRFIQNHLDAQNEIYPYACGKNDKDNVDFTIVCVNNGEVTDHSFSSFEIKEAYRNSNPEWVDSLPKSKIKVNIVITTPDRLGRISMNDCSSEIYDWLSKEILPPNENYVIRDYIISEEIRPTEWATLDFIIKDRELFSKDDFILYLHTKGASHEYTHIDVDINNLDKYKNLFTNNIVEKYSCKLCYVI